MKAFLEKTFKISENKSTVRTEILAGLTTFFAMCYIVVVNPDSIVSGVDGHLWNAVYVGGILATVIATLLYAFYAKKPFAQASGMGLNSFFFVSFLLPVVLNGGDLYEAYGAGLVAILLSGIIFLILSVTKVRAYIAVALPDCLKKAIPAGIGLFIALIGFKNAGIVVANQYTFVALVDFASEGAWTVAGPALAAFIGFVAIAVLAKSKVEWLRKTNIILGVLISAVLYYVFTWTVPNFAGSVKVGEAFSDFAKYGLSAFKASSWEALFGGKDLSGIFSVVMIIITYCLVDMFDTIGTLYGTCAQAGMLDANGDPIDLDKCMMCDSIGTVEGALLGTSTITTYVESASGVAEGGRTGLTALVVSILFFACLFITPLASIIPTAATAPALIYVGVLMLKNFSKVNMDDAAEAVPAFLALIIMPLTYSISNGIGVGAIAYVLIRILTGKYTKKDIVVTVIALVFALRYAVVTM